MVWVLQLCIFTSVHSNELQKLQGSGSVANNNKIHVITINPSFPLKSQWYLLERGSQELLI